MHVYKFTLWFLVVNLSGLVPTCELSAQQQRVDVGGLAGAPIVMARQKAIDSRPFRTQIDRDKLRRWMEISALCTMAEFELFLSPLVPAEQQLLEKIKTIPAPIVNRLHFEDLRSVLKHGQLSSYREDKRLDGDLKHTTPALENALYGAFNCVFASIGPPDGSPRYGDVIIRLKDSVREKGWATPFSGIHFLSAIRHKDAQLMQELLAKGSALPSRPTDPLSLGFDDRLHFSHYVVTEKHWNRALAYQAILVLRNADDSPAGTRIRRRFERLLAEDRSQAFWKLFIPARERELSPEASAERVPFGYLEGKFDGHLAIDEFTSIEVPVEKLNEVRSWPEAQSYLNLISGRPSNVP